jgi:hypothetical protein
MELIQQQTYILHPTEAVTAQRDADDLSYVWFTEGSSQNVHYFSLARSHGDGSFYSERDDQKWGAYNGLTGVTFDDESLTVHFDKPTATRLGGIETVVVDCSRLSEPIRRQVGTTLAYMFAGSDVALTTA